MLSSYPEGWAERDQDLLQDIAQLGKPDQGCRVRDILELFRILRNRFKHDESALEQYGGKLRDLMRRLVAATTGAYRLGKIASEGSSIDLWSKERREGVESSPLMGDSSRWEGRLVIASQISVDGGEADAYKAMFPVDDLIRVREEKGSLWGYYKSKSIWMNLTHYEGSGEAEQLSAAKNRWLPNERELVSSELWKSVHDV
jgi:hypothetical protein